MGRVYDDTREVLAFVVHPGIVSGILDVARMGFIVGDVFLVVACEEEGYIYKGIWLGFFNND